MLFCILLDYKLYRALYPHQRSSLDGLISKFGHALGISFTVHLGVLILWGALFRLLVAENVSHFAFKGNSVYRVVTGSVPQKIL